MADQTPLPRMAAPTPPPLRGAGERHSLDRPPEQARPAASGQQDASPVTAARAQAGGNGGANKPRFNMPKIGNPFAGLSGKFSGLTGKLPENWWIGAILLLALVGGYLYFSANGVPNFSAGGTGRALVFPGMPGVKVVVTLALVALVIDCVLGLVEAQNREDPFWLDWWIPYAVVGVLVYGQLFGFNTMVWGLAMGVAGASLFFATIWNPSDQEDPQILDRIDTTAIFRTCFILGILFLAKWSAVPFPTFIPLIVVIVIGALAIFKELMRTPKFALLVILLGIAAAVFYNPLWIFGTLAASVVMAAFGAHQGWIPGASQKRTEVTVPPIMGRKLKLILAWDVVLCWFAVFILTAIILYHNPVLMIIGAL